MLWRFVRWQINNEDSEELPASVVGVEAVREDSGGGRSVHCNVLTLQIHRPVLFEKLPAVSFITLFARARRWSLLRMKSCKSTIWHSVSTVFVLILSSHLRLNFQSFLSPRFSTYFYMHFLSFPIVLRLPLTVPWVYHRHIFWAVKIVEIPIMYFSFVSCYFFPLMEKLSPQHFVSQLLRSVSFCQCERPAVIPYVTRYNIIVFTLLDVWKGKGSKV